MCRSPKGRFLKKYLSQQGGPVLRQKVSLLEKRESRSSHSSFFNRAGKGGGPGTFKSIAPSSLYPQEIGKSVYCVCCAIRNVYGNSLISLPILNFPAGDSRKWKKTSQTILSSALLKRVSAKLSPNSRTVAPMDTSLIPAPPSPFRRTARSLPPNIISVQTPHP